MDPSGGIYVTGGTSQQNFTVTPNAFQKTLIGNRNAFVTKFGADGTTLLYSSYLVAARKSLAGLQWIRMERPISREP